MFDTLPPVLLEKILARSKTSVRMALRLSCKSLYTKINNVCNRVVTVEQCRKHNIIPLLLRSDSLTGWIIDIECFRFIKTLWVPITGTFFQVVTFENFPCLKAVKIDAVLTSDTKKMLNVESVVLINSDSIAAIRHLPNELYSLTINTLTNEIAARAAGPLPSGLQRLIIKDSYVTDRLIESMIPKSVKYLRINNNEQRRHTPMVNMLSLDLPELEYFDGNVDIKELKASKLKKFQIRVKKFNNLPTIEHLADIENLSMVDYCYNKPADARTSTDIIFLFFTANNTSLYSLQKLHTLDVDVPLGEMLDLTPLPTLRNVSLQYDRMCKFSEMFKLSDNVQTITLRSRTYISGIELDVLPRSLTKLCCKECFITSIVVPDNLEIMTHSMHFEFTHRKQLKNIRKIETVNYSISDIEYSTVDATIRGISVPLIMSLSENVTKLTLTGYNYDRDINLTHFTKLKWLCINIHNTYQIELVGLSNTVKYLESNAMIMNLDSLNIENFVLNYAADDTVHLTSSPLCLKHLTVTGNVVFDIEELPDSIVNVIDRGAVNHHQLYVVHRLPQNLVRLKSTKYINFTSDCNVPPGLVILKCANIKYQTEFTSRVPAYVIF